MGRTNLHIFPMAVVAMVTLFKDSTIGSHNNPTIKNSKPLRFKAENHASN
jgi:hypothetical protein